MNVIVKYWTLLDRQTHLTWRRARALHTRFDCAGVRLGGERTGYIETISWKKIEHQILVSGGQLRGALLSENKLRKSNASRMTWDISLFEDINAYKIKIK